MCCSSPRGRSSPKSACPCARTRPKLGRMKRFRAAMPLATRRRPRYGRAIPTFPRDSPILKKSLFPGLAACAALSACLAAAPAFAQAPKVDPALHDQALELLKKGIAFHTVIPGDQVKPYAEYLKGVLVAHGYKPDEVRIEPVAGSSILIARFPGE